MDLLKLHMEVQNIFICIPENHLNKEQIAISNITIEHIMPQKLTPQWQIELGKKYEDIHAQYLHTIKKQII